jgi:hypothetical protein
MSPKQKSGKWHPYRATIPDKNAGMHVNGGVFGCVDWRVSRFGSDREMMRL